MAANNGLPSNWADLDTSEKLDEIMITLSKVDMNQEVMVEEKTVSELSLRKLQLKVAQLEGRNSRLEQELGSLQSKYLDLQQRSMQHNLVFHGLKETNHEDCEKITITFIFQSLKISQKDIYSSNNLAGEIRIDVAHRSGRKSDLRGKPCPMVVRFVTRKGKDMVLKSVRNLKGTSYSVTEQLPPVIREQRQAQIPKLQQLRRDFPDKKKDSVKLVNNKLIHNTHIVGGEFIKNPLPATQDTNDVYDYNDLLHSEIAECNDSFFQAHAITVGTIREACLARDALYQNMSLSQAHHVIYAYHFTDNSGEQHEGFSDDGEVRGSMELRKVLDRLGKNNIFVAVTRIHNGPNIGQRRFDFIRKVTEEVLDNPIL